MNKKIIYLAAKKTMRSCFNTIFSESGVGLGVMLEANCGVGLGQNLKYLSAVQDSRNILEGNASERHNHGRTPTHGQQHVRSFLFHKLQTEWADNKYTNRKTRKMTTVILDAVFAIFTRHVYESLRR